MISGLLVLAGFIALYYGAEWLVKGSSALALRFGLPPLLVGLTVVAYGTSSPEMVVSVMASLRGEGDLAIGNVVGSNILNIGLILGLTACIAPLRIEFQLLKFDTPFMVAIGFLFLWIFRDSSLERSEGLALVGLAIGYTIASILIARRTVTPKVEREYAEQAVGLAAASGPKLGKTTVLIMGGLLVLIVGSRAFVIGASDLARLWGVSEALIGLTIVSVGTSLPELASSLIAAVRKQADIAVGNIVGSCIFNVLAIAGAASVLKPIVAPGIARADVWVMLAMMVAFMGLSFTGFRIRRWEGAVLLLGYAGYLAWLWPD
ncbi:MAG: calcium/sodium antiporter [Verrucomicrobiaceae bacterium]|nr:MAG: calcium/sodium antiporter [Verrucomicrobiaceae bacterium]